MDSGPAKTIWTPSPVDDSSKKAQSSIFSGKAGRSDTLMGEDDAFRVSSSRYILLMNPTIMSNHM